jgi:hypothetical protein
VIARDAQEALAAEAVRLYRRYAIEIVEELGLCPYAQRCREEGGTEEVVLTDESPPQGAIVEALDGLGQHVEIGLIILPRLAMDRLRMGRWVERLRKAHGAAQATGRPVWALEAFHPDAVADLTTPGRLTPFLRRTPDPTIQATRLVVLERVKRAAPQGTAFVDPAKVPDLMALLTRDRPRSISERIAETNHRTVSAVGPEEVGRRIEDIHADRERSYAALL